MKDKFRLMLGKINRVLPSPRAIPFFIACLQAAVFIALGIALIISGKGDKAIMPLLLVLFTAEIMLYRYLDWRYERSTNFKLGIATVIHIMENDLDHGTVWIRSYKNKKYYLKMVPVEPEATVGESLQGSAKMPTKVVSPKPLSEMIAKGNSAGSKFSDDFNKTKTAKTQPKKRGRPAGTKNKKIQS
jgi:hypothetical protein